MCFRPADASADTGVSKCPECGKALQAMGGMVLKKCPFCKCDFTPYLNGEKPLPDAVAPSAPAAPSVPKPPVA